MSEKIEEARRAKFEALFFPGRRGTPKPTVSECYVETVDEARWQGFNAALDAVEIELPEPHFEFDGDTCGELFDSQVRAAIESTGLGLRIK